MNWKTTLKITMERLLWLDSFQKPSLGMSGQDAGVCNTEMWPVPISCYFIHFPLELREALPAGSSTETWHAVGTSSGNIPPNAVIILRCGAIHNKEVENYDLPG